MLAHALYSQHQLTPSWSVAGKRMTKADDFENRTVSWWLKQLSLRQIWGLLGAQFVLVAGALSAGVWFGKSDQAPTKSAEIAQQTRVVVPQAGQLLPSEITEFDVKLLRVLAEPMPDWTTNEYLAYRLGATTTQVEEVLEKLIALKLVIHVHVKDQNGIEYRINSSLSDEGRKYMLQHNLF